MLGFLKQLLQKQRKITIKGNIMKFNDNQNYYAGALCNSDFLCIETYNGIHLSDEAKQYLLSPDANSQTIGESIILALFNSKPHKSSNANYTSCSMEEYKKLSKEYQDAQIQKYNTWKENLMQKYNYKNKKALFQDMKHCSIYLKNGVITIGPSRHEKLEAWGRTRGDGIEDVILSLDNSTEEIGAGLKLAFSRCI